MGGQGGSHPAQVLGMAQNLPVLLLLQPAVTTLMQNLHLTLYQQVQFQKEG